MNRFLTSLLAVCAFSFAALAFAEVVPPTTPVTDFEFLQAVLAAVGGLKGASVLVVAGVVAQLIQVLFRSKYGDFAGKWKLLACLFTTWVVVIVGNMIAGLPFLQSVVNGPALAALQVFVYQLVKQLTEAPVVNPIGRPL